MSRGKRILVVRPVEPNRGDVLSRYGLLRLMAESGLDEGGVVLTERQADELPGRFATVRPGPCKDLLPRREQWRHLRQGDEVWWACGHDMQDDSSQLKLPFLWVKFLTYRLLGLRVRILAQGAGPLTTAPGRFWIRRILALADAAAMRDEDSLALVRSIAPAQSGKLSLAADMALFAAEPAPAAPGSGPARVLGVNLRRWFHFDGHWLPYEYRVRLGLLRTPPGEERMDRALATLAGLLDRAVEEYGVSLRLIPMYPPGQEPWEDDAALLGRLRERMRHAAAATLFAGDCSPAGLLAEFAGVDAMLGVRLHSTIAATLLGKPALHLAYSPKGASYFRRIGMEECCLPYAALSDGREAEVWDSLRRLIVDREALSARAAAGVAALQERHRGVVAEWGGLRRGGDAA